MVQNIAIFVITTLIGLLIGFIGKSIKDARTQREATKSLLRTEMVKIYYKYRDEEKVPYYIKKAWLDNYASYKGLNGNSFIDDLKVEVDDWDIE